jgi:Uncharacterized conserved protein, contains double-stranded beta-helix domain
MENTAQSTSTPASTAFTKGLVLQPEDGKSFWQPVPANGHVIVKLTPEIWDGPFSMGVQMVAPRSYIRQHSHDQHREVVFTWGGQGTVVVNGEEHPMVPGTLIALPPLVDHIFRNDSDTEDLKLVWIICPGGLENFFEAVGRPRTPGEPTPPNFPRPENVLEIEANTVFTSPKPESK